MHIWVIAYSELYTLRHMINENVYHIENYIQVDKWKLLKLFSITTVATCCVNLIEENLLLQWIEIIKLHEQIKSWTLMIRKGWILNCSWTVNKIILNYSRQSCWHTRVSGCCHSTAQSCWHTRVSSCFHSTAQSCWHTRVSGSCHSMIQVAAPQN